MDVTTQVVTNNEEDIYDEETADDGTCFVPVHDRVRFQ